MIYVASPYTSPLVDIQTQRHAAAAQFTLRLLLAGYPAFSPIVYAVPFAKAATLPEDAAYWNNFNMSFLRKAEAIFCLNLPGWDQSKGVIVELKMAKVLNIPVVHFDTEFNEIKSDSNSSVIAMPFKGKKN